MCHLHLLRVGWADDQQLLCLLEEYGGSDEASWVLLEPVTPEDGGEQGGDGRHLRATNKQTRKVGGSECAVRRPQ